MNTLYEQTPGGINVQSGRGRLYEDGSERGVLAISGATGTETQWFDIDFLFHEMRTMTDHFGFPVAGIGSYNYWGNQALMDRMLGVKDHHTEDSGLFRDTARVHLLGISAGGLAALNFAYHYPELVKSVCIVIPVVDVQDIYDNNRSGFQSVINTAYGGRPGDEWNPASHPEALRSVPTLIYASEDDPVTPWSVTEAYVEDSGAELVSMGAINHFWGDPWDRYRAGAWFRRYNGS